MTAASLFNIKLVEVDDSNLANKPPAAAAATAAIAAAAAVAGAAVAEASWRLLL